MIATRILMLLLLALSVSFPLGGTVFGQAPPALPTTAVDDGSIKGFFLANNGGVDFSIDPNDPGEDGDEERPNYALLASIMSSTKPTTVDQIRAAETNTDIDVRIIRDAAKESLGDLIFFRTYLAMGDTEAARFHYEKISRQMLDVQMEVGFTTPIEQITLIESESDEEDQSNSGERFSELEEREQEAIEEGRLPPNPTHTTLNASDINELAIDVRTNLGAMVGASSSVYGDPTRVTAYANQMADSLLKIYYSMNFAVPLEQVQIIGSTAPYIEELKQPLVGTPSPLPSTLSTPIF